MLSCAVLSCSLYWRETSAPYFTFYYIIWGPFNINCVPSSFPILSISASPTFILSVSFSLSLILLLFFLNFCLYVPISSGFLPSHFLFLFIKVWGRWWWWRWWWWRPEKRMVWRRCWQEEKWQWRLSSLIIFFTLTSCPSVCLPHILSHLI